MMRHHFLSSWRINYQSRGLSGTLRRYAMIFFFFEFQRCILVPVRSQWSTSEALLFGRERGATWGRYQGAACGASKIIGSTIFCSRRLNNHQWYSWRCPRIFSPPPNLLRLNGQISDTFENRIYSFPAATVLRNNEERWPERSTLLSFLSWAVTVTRRFWRYRTNQWSKVSWGNQMSQTDSPVPKDVRPRFTSPQHHGALIYCI